MTLHEQFPNSVRVQRLFGMYLEAIGDYGEARRLYNYQISQDPANTIARKRLVAILKSQKRIPEAVAQLNDYLEMFMVDFDAWAELADLYINANDFRQAAFCLEELILSNPLNYFYMLKFADIKYSEGGSENLETARAYYCQAFHLNPHSLRSLYGIFLSASGLAMAASNSGSKSLLSLVSSANTAASAEASADLASFAVTAAQDRDSKKSNLNLVYWAVKKLNVFKLEKEDRPRMPKELKQQVMSVLKEEDTRCDCVMEQAPGPATLEKDAGDILLRKFFVIPEVDSKSTNQKATKNPPRRNQKVKDQGELDQAATKRRPTSVGDESSDSD
ncbi:ER membrane complex subunit 2 [Cichlidogyrus casuarinus]|uniref:ER membrane protein complex subunit 2 n=1 Tax=Cichlidogyrus casuarinus TaxID=1844966 RepID=A0ABD2Q8H9_9PLAT